MGPGSHPREAARHPAAGGGSLSADETTAGCCLLPSSAPSTLPVVGVADDEVSSVESS